MSERPVAPPDATTRALWDATREHRLLVQRCGSCEATQHVPRSFCAACGARDPEPVEASGFGSVWSFTIVRRSPSPAFAPPYFVALVRLDEGPVLLTNIVGVQAESVRCDARVRVVWEDLPDGRALPMFTPTGD